MSSKPKRVVIGIDPHKRINAVAVVNKAGDLIARDTFANSSDGCRALQRFARRWRARTWAVEGAGGVGKHLAQRLVAAGERVLDVPTKKSSLVRAFLADSGRKTDDIDALTVALVGLRTPDLLEVTVDGSATLLRLLSQRRRELSAARTQTVNRLHRELQILLPGGSSRRLTAAHAKTLLASVRPRDDVGKLRKRLASDLLADLTAIDRRLKALADDTKAAVGAADTTVTDVFGVGPTIAAMIIGETRSVSRFRTRHHYGSYNGTAPADWGSGGPPQPGVNTGGNRQLNHAIHLVAIVQLRFPCPGRTYYDRKLAEGKTTKEALRCLKRRISDAIYRRLVADEARKAGPGGQMGATLESSATDPIPMAGTSDKPLSGPAPKPKPAAALAS